ncbi:TRAP transporter permease [Halorussus salinisoli]|uniref:TRAP transporter permease n=1 Tax=Halorussus salinisoli TaxID=2558242 RepID=UPI0010C22641|nr:TRAP transporter fused permease subunit [Halorussus salinisoli]
MAFGETRQRTAKYAVLIALGVASLVYHLWFTRTYGLEMNKHIVVHVALMLLATGIVAFEPGAETTRERVGNAVALLEGVAGFLTAGYIVLGYDRIVYQQLGVYTTADTAAGLLIVLLALDLCRRIYGPILSVVGVVGIVYALYGPYFPGLLHHQGVDPLRFIQGITVGFGSGVFGIITKVSATYIVVFMILAGLLEAYGALEYFIKLGSLLGGRIQSGIAQMTTIASMGMGSVNGSAAANAATTGAFTIPLLKNHDVEKDTAAAFEAVASSGGQIMPPVMGAAAFIMAQITGEGYLTVITVGFLPALLFYGTVSIGVHLTTLKEGITDTADTDELSEMDTGQQERSEALASLFGSSTDPVSFDGVSARRLLVDGLALWVPLGVLLFTLVVLLYEPLYAGFWAIIAAFIAAFLQGIFFRDRYGVKDFAIDTLDGCARGLENAAPLAVALMVMNLFVGVLNLTGFTQTFAQNLIALSGGMLPLLLVFAMAAALLFGLGMPTVAAYITSVLLIAPALTNMGIDLLSAHFFVFYFAILSALTPPVAIACLVTSEISGGTFWRTARKSLVLAGPLFVLPYVFVVNDSLLYWTFPQTITTFLVLGAAFIAMVISFVNYLAGELPVALRGALFAVSATVMFAPILPATPLVRGVGAILIATMVLWRLNSLPASLQTLLGQSSN